VRLDALDLGAKSLVCYLPGDGERWRTEVEGIDRVRVASSNLDSCRTSRGAGPASSLARRPMRVCTRERLKKFEADQF